MIDKIPSANSTAEIFNFLDKLSRTLVEASRSKSIHPPNFDSLPSLPKNRLASVTVGSFPPLP